MTDPKDELGARFDDRKADSTDEDSGSSDNIDNTDNTDSTNNSSNTGDSNDADSANNMGNTGGTDNTDNTGNSNNKPGPNKDETATRHRRQVPMYLPDKKANTLNKLYERLDGRSKVAGEGAIEKHADFMEALVEFAADHEDDLAERLDISE